MIYKKKITTALCFCFSLFVLGCGENRPENVSNEGSGELFESTMSQGVSGKVKYFEGNHMPGVVGEVNGKGSSSPVSRAIHIYKSTKTNENTPKTPGSVFYETINSELVSVVYSGEDGFYQASLPVGEYSVFTEETQGLYANTFDSELVINPVSVEEASVSHLDIDITYNASF